MATTTTKAAKAGWTDFAILQASSGGKEWRVQINAEGTFRCNCPSFIFCKVQPRACKHTRRCEEQRLAEQKGVAFVTTIATLPAPAAANPFMAEAQSVFTAMCEGARKSVSFNPATHLGPTATRIMTEVLAARLALFNPEASITVAPPPAGVVGVRRITFDD